MKRAGNFPLVIWPMGKNHPKNHSLHPLHFYKQKEKSKYLILLNQIFSDNELAGVPGLTSSQEEEDERLLQRNQPFCRFLAKGTHQCRAYSAWRG